MRRLVRTFQLHDLGHSSQWCTEDHISARTCNWKNQNSNGRIWLQRTLVQKCNKRVKTAFWEPNLIISSLLEKLINYRPAMKSCPWTIVICSTFINTMTKTLQELNFAADLNSTTILKQSTDKLPFSTEFKWNQFVLRQRIKQLILADSNQWIKEIAGTHECSTHQGRIGTSFNIASDANQRNFNSNGNQQFHQDQLFQTGNNSNNNQIRT